MSVFFLKRPSSVQFPIPKVNITGSGNTDYCWVGVNNTIYSSAVDEPIEVKAGEKINFTVYGFSTTYYGAITINGVQVAKVTSKTTTTYTWTVPEKTIFINIAMTYTSSSTKRNGKIVVTTS